MLINCPECHKEVSSESKFCSECGAKVAGAMEDSASFEDRDEICDIEDDERATMNEQEPASIKEESRCFSSKDLLPSKKRKTILVSIIAVSLLVFIAGGAFAFISNSNYEKGMYAIEKGNYEQAITYLEKSRGETSKKSLQLANKLSQSETKFNSGMDLYNKREYADALAKLSKVSSVHPQYNKAKELVVECKNILANDCLQQAKDLYSSKKYTDAYDMIQKSLTYNPSFEEAIKLEETYNNKYKEEQDTLAKQAEGDCLQSIKDNMNQWEGSGVYIAVGKAYKKNSTSLHVANGNGTFVYINVSALNKNGNITHVNPNDFTLSTATGYTVSHDSDTYSLSNYFDAVDLGTNQQTSGYLIFYVKNESEYTLNYNGFGGSASKQIAL